MAMKDVKSITVAPEDEEGSVRRFSLSDGNSKAHRR
jgi:hypothetical protein